MADPSARRAIPAQYKAPLWSLVGWVLLGLGLITSAYFANKSGLWALVGLIAWFSSYGLAIILRVGIGPHTLKEAFDYKKQSWAFLADAPVAFAIAAASYGWRYLGDGYYRQWWWLLTALVLALAFLAVRIKWLDWPNFIYKEDAEELLGDPWKGAHDCTSLVVLACLAVLFCVPVLFAGASWHHWVVPMLVLLGLAPWLLALPHETKLNVWNLHDVFNWKTRRYEPNYVRAQKG